MTNMYTSLIRIKLIAWYDLTHPYEFYIEAYGLNDLNFWFESFWNFWFMLNFSF